MIMRRLFVYFLAALVILAVAGCKGNKKVKTDITGVWELEEFSGLRASEQNVVVYVEFLKDGNFDLFQRIGDGRFEHYTGSWTLTDDVLSGKYSDGKKLADMYDVSLSSDRKTLTLKSQKNSEESVYRKSSIPSSVRDEARTKASGHDSAPFL